MAMRPVSSVSSGRPLPLPLITTSNTTTTPASGKQDYTVEDDLQWFATASLRYAVHSCDLLLQMSHVPWSVCVCVLGIGVSCVKMAEPIEMPRGGLTHVGLVNMY